MTSNLICSRQKDYAQLPGTTCAERRAFGLRKSRRQFRREYTVLRGYIGTKQLFPIGVDIVSDIVSELK
jgi:hypothetical protein